MRGVKKAFLPVFTFARIDVKRLFRDKVAIFFVFIFPLIFLLVFGGIFGRDSGISFKVAMISESQSQFSREFVEQARQDNVLKIDEKVKTLDEAKIKMNRGELDATIILPSEFGEVKNDKFPSGKAIVLYEQDNEQAGRTLGSILEAVFGEINRQFVTAEMPFTVALESTATKGLTRFDYTFAGLLGFTILSLGIFGPTSVFPRLKQKGVLRRYHTTTLKVWQYFTGNVISNAIVGLMAITLMFIAAVLIFNLNMRGDYVSLIIVSIMGVTMMFGIGLALGGWARTENQAAPLAQIVSFPMMFLSGVFFPTFLMPQWLQTVTQFIPLTSVIDSFRYVITEGKTIFELGPQLLIIGGWTIIIYVIAFKVFRWE